MLPSLLFFIISIPSKEKAPGMSETPPNKPGAERASSEPASASNKADRAKGLARARQRRFMEKRKKQHMELELEKQRTAQYIAQTQVAQCNVDAQVAQRNLDAQVVQSNLDAQLEARRIAANAAGQQQGQMLQHVSHQQGQMLQHVTSPFPAPQASYTNRQLSPQFNQQLSPQFAPAGIQSAVSYYNNAMSLFHPPTFLQQQQLPHHAAPPQYGYIDPSALFHGNEHLWAQQQQHSAFRPHAPDIGDAPGLASRENGGHATTASVSDSVTASRENGGHATTASVSDSLTASRENDGHATTASVSDSVTLGGGGSSSGAPEHSVVNNAEMASHSSNLQRKEQQTSAVLPTAADKHKRSDRNDSSSNGSRQRRRRSDDPEEKKQELPPSKKRRVVAVTQNDHLIVPVNTQTVVEVEKKVDEPALEAKQPTAGNPSADPTATGTVENAIPSTAASIPSTAALAQMEDSGRHNFASGATDATADVGSTATVAETTGTAGPSQNTKAAPTDQGKSATDRMAEEPQGVPALPALASEMQKNDLMETESVEEEEIPTTPPRNRATDVAVGGNNGVLSSGESPNGNSHAIAHFHGGAMQTPDRGAMVGRPGMAMQEYHGGAMPPYNTSPRRPLTPSQVYHQIRSVDPNMSHGQAMELTALEAHAELRHRELDQQCGVAMVGMAASVATSGIQHKNVLEQNDRQHTKELDQKESHFQTKHLQEEIQHQETLDQTKDTDNKVLQQTAKHNEEMLDHQKELAAKKDKRRIINEATSLRWQIVCALCVVNAVLPVLSLLSSLYNSFDRCAFSKEWSIFSFFSSSKQAEESSGDWLNIKSVTWICYVVDCPTASVTVEESCGWGDVIGFFFSVIVMLVVYAWLPLKPLVHYSAMFLVAKSCWVNADGNFLLEVVFLTLSITGMGALSWQITTAMELDPSSTVMQTNLDNFKKNCNYLFLFQSIAIGFAAFYHLKTPDFWSWIQFVVVVGLGLYAIVHYLSQ